MIFLLKYIWLKIRGPKYKNGQHLPIPLGFGYMQIDYNTITTSYHKPFYLYRLYHTNYLVSEEWINEEIEKYKQK